MELLRNLLICFLIIYIPLDIIRGVIAFEVVRSTSNLRRRGWRKNQKGYIYAFTDFPLLFLAKIGRANNYEGRLNSHRTSAPFGIIVFTLYEVEDTVLAERLIHSRFKRERYNREWFVITPAIITFFLLVKFWAPRLRYKKSVI